MTPEAVAKLATLEASIRALDASASLNGLTLDVNVLSDLLGNRFTPDELGDLIDPPETDA